MPDQVESNGFTVFYDADQDAGVLIFGALDAEGRPPEGAVSQALQFQHGPIAENGVNGIQNEPLLALLTLRLRALNAKFPCRENSLAITHIEEALHWLEARTASRRKQGVEGQNLAHVS